MPSHAFADVLLAVPTYRRPEGLRRLLAAIARLEVPPGCRLKVAVADNGPFQEARAIVEGFRAASPGIAYLWVPRRGLAAVRNAAIDHALAQGATHLAFIDDDEAPHPDWLVQHMAVMRARLADGSVGAVQAAYDGRPPEWLRRGRFLEFHGPADGARMPHGATCNVVFALAPVRVHGLRFDPAYDQAGGEDTVFFDSYMRHGGELVFAARAVVEETVPVRRQGLGWLWRRWRRTGQTNGEMLCRRSPGALGFAGCLAGGLIRVAAGGALALAALPAAALGSPAWARGLRIAARGAGFLDAGLGHRTLEYAAPER